MYNNNKKGHVYTFIKSFILVLHHQISLIFVQGLPRLRPVYYRLSPRRHGFVHGQLFANGPGSSVGIATGYGLDGPGIESRWGRDFPHLSRPALGPTQPPVKWVLGFSGGQRAAGA